VELQTIGKAGHTGITPTLYKKSRSRIEWLQAQKMETQNTPLLTCWDIFPKAVASKRDWQDAPDL
jgi:hypothetical protein